MNEQVSSVFFVEKDRYNIVTESHDPKIVAGVNVEALAPLENRGSDTRGK